MSPDYREARTPTTLEGVVLGGRYRTEGLLGSGRTSVVYRGVDLAVPGGERRVAIKALHPSLRRDPREREALIEEGARLRVLAHGSIVALYDTVREAPAPFLVLELLEGGSLRAMTRECRPTSPRRVAALLDGVADALAFLHASGWVHADIKPGNLLLDRRGVAKLIDFGSLRRRGALQDSVCERIVTPPYASPEVLQGKAPEPRDDVFSLATVLYELLAGRHPFDYRPAMMGDVVSPVPDLSSRGWSVLAAALALRRAERPADPRDLIAALRRGWSLPHSLRRVASCPI